MSAKGLRAYYSVQVLDLPHPGSGVDRWEQISETGSKADAVTRARAALVGYGVKVAVRVQRVVEETVFELAGGEDVSHD